MVGAPGSGGFRRLVNRFGRKRRGCRRRRGRGSGRRRGFRRLVNRFGRKRRACRRGRRRRFRCGRGRGCRRGFRLLVNRFSRNRRRRRRGFRRRLGQRQGDLLPAGPVRVRVERPVHVGVFHIDVFERKSNSVHIQRQRTEGGFGVRSIYGQDEPQEQLIQVGVPIEGLYLIGDVPVGEVIVGQGGRAVVHLGRARVVTAVIFTLFAHRQRGGPDGGLALGVGGLSGGCDQADQQEGQPAKAKQRGYAPGGQVPRNVGHELKSVHILRFLG